MPALREELDKLGGEDIMIIVGGVIPPEDDFAELRRLGAEAIFPPGTVIPPEAAAELVKKLRRKLDEGSPVG